MNDLPEKGMTQNAPTKAIFKNLLAQIQATSQFRSLSMTALNPRTPNRANILLTEDLRFIVPFWGAQFVETKMLDETNPTKLDAVVSSSKISCKENFIWRDFDSLLCCGKTTFCISTGPEKRSFSSGNRIWKQEVYTVSSSSSWNKLIVARFKSFQRGACYES